MMQRDRKREGLRVCRAAWLIGVSVREYREIDAGDALHLDGGRGQVERGGIGGFELTCRRNLIYYVEGKAVGDYGGGHCAPDVCLFDRNLYWNASGKPVLFANKSFSEWQAAAQDKTSLIADPMFVDPAHGDFALGLVDFLLLAFWKLPPWLVVVLSALGGAVLGRQ